jgi:signal peptide peptidase SppA
MSKGGFALGGRRLPVRQRMASRCTTTSTIWPTSTLRSRWRVVSGSKSFYLAKKVIEEYFGGVAFAAPANVYLALCTTIPTDASTGSTIVETDYTSYARTQIGTGNNQTDAWNAATGSTTATVTNKNAITDPSLGDDMSTENSTPKREASRYPRIVQFVTETPWSILPSKLHAITEMVALHVRGEELTDEEIQARIGAGPARRNASKSEGVAVIPIYGVITPKADLMTDMSGGTSIDRLQQSFRAAVADPNVSAIVLDIDSPGGSVSMLTEMAAEIRAARSVKPIVAVANTMAASAAYQFASQASELVVTPSGSVGSIGTIAAHDDISEMLANEGVKTTVVTSSKFKGEMSPFQPLSDEAKAQLQKTVDAHGRQFELDVARGRGVPVATVRSDFGQGRMLMAKDAVAAGMADRVDTLDNVIADRLASDKTPGRKLANLGDEVAQICAKFDLDPSQVARIDIRPREIAAEVYELDDRGEKFVDPETGKAAMRSVAMPITTIAQPPPGERDETEDIEAAESGLSFADDAKSAPDALEQFCDRLTSLAEVKRGRLTAAKREQVTACRDRAGAVAAALTEALQATNPVDHQAAVAKERLRFERSRFEGATR